MLNFMSIKQMVTLYLLHDREFAYGLDLVNDSNGALTRAGVYFELNSLEDQGYVHSYMESQVNSSGFRRKRFVITTAGTERYSQFSDEDLRKVQVEISKTPFQRHGFNWNMVALMIAVLALLYVGGSHLFGSTWSAPVQTNAASFHMGDYVIVSNPNEPFYFGQTGRLIGTTGVFYIVEMDFPVQAPQKLRYNFKKGELRVRTEEERARDRAD